MMMVAIPSGTFAQVTNLGNVPFNPASFVGLENTQNYPLQIRHNGNQPINIFTNNTLRGFFTTPTFFSGGNTQGGGLRIVDPNGDPGHLDLWTSNFQQTHIKWNGSGLIQGRNNRFELCAYFNGMWFNVHNGANARYIFNRDSTELGRIGVNRFWRIGDNAGSVDAARRLQVVDNAPQFRISRTTGNWFTDFETNTSGHLLVNPNGQRVGINTGTTNPTHNLHVNGNARIQNVTAATAPNSLVVGVNVSGVNDLELRRLAFTGNAGDVLLGNGTWGAASVNANNGLSLSSGVAQLGQGNNCAATGPGQLLNDRFIPMNNFNLVFADAGTSQQFSSNRIGVGVCAPTAKVDILRPAIGPNEVLPTALRVTNTDVSAPGQFLGTSMAGNFVCNGLNRENRALFIEANSANTNYGIISNAISYNGTGGFNVGGEFSSDENKTNAGVYGVANNINNSSIPEQNFGVVGIAHNASILNYGVYGHASGPGTSQVWAGYFNGEVFATLGYQLSDKKFKSNVSNLDGKSAIAILNQLVPKTYEYNSPANSGLNLPSGKHLGFIAQDIESVLPELVKEIISPEIRDANGNVYTTSEKFKGVNYIGLIPILTGSIKEQQATIDSLANVIEIRLTALENALSQCCAIGGGAAFKNGPDTEGVNDLSVELSSKNVVVLEQNVPNPFAEQTTINFYLPENIAKAKMLFYNVQGILIKEMDITERGHSRLTVFASDLSSGIYTYTLVTDGNIAETKRMVKSK